MNPVLFGVVVDNVDPDKLGRVQVRLADYSGDVTLPWLRVLQPLASDASHVTLFMPQADDHVVILQGPGGPSGMVVIGSVHTGKRKPLALGEGKAGDPLVRGMLTPAGHEIVVDDTKGSETILVRTKDGAVALTLDGANKTLTVDAETELIVNAPKGTVTVNCDKIEVVGKSEIKLTSSSGKVVVDASNVEIGGKSGVKVTGAKIDLG